MWSGPSGCCSPIADGMKLLFKETILPTGANRVVFIMAPMLTFTLALIAWAVIPVRRRLGAGRHQRRHPLSLRDLLARRLRHPHGRAGPRNSKYAFLGGLRSAAQMVSYEVSMGFVIITRALCVGSLNLSDIVKAQRHVWFVPFRCSRCS